MENNNNEIKINVPEGMEIDKENSTFECIKFKKKIDFTPQKGHFIYITTTHNYWYLCIYDHMDEMVINGYLIQDDGGRVSVQTKTLPIIRMGEVADIKLASCYQVQDMLDRIDMQGYKWSDGKIQKKLADSWEVFCETNQIGEDEYFFDRDGAITKRARYSRRDKFTDAMTVPDQDNAKAIRALCQLIQLRDHYNDGWKPEWENEKEIKYCIECCLGQTTGRSYIVTSNVLAFKTAELRDQFLENFRDLIEIAKPLL